MVGKTLSTNREVIEHFYHVWQVLMDTESKLSAKGPGFNDIKQVVISNVDLWRKASLAMIEAKSAQNKLKNVIEKFLTARKQAKKFKCSINEDWFDKLFNLSRCRCEILETVGTYQGKLLCTCKFNDRIPEKEIEFLKDQWLSKEIYYLNQKIWYSTNIDSKSLQKHEITLKLIRNNPFVARE